MGRGEREGVRERQKSMQKYFADNRANYTQNELQPRSQFPSPFPLALRFSKFVLFPPPFWLMRRVQAAMSKDANNQ